MPYIALQDSNIFFTDSGPRDAPCLLFVHGLACDAHDWSWQIPVFEKNYRVIAFDLVGHGRSTPRPDRYHSVDFANDAAALLHSLGIEKVIAIGHSLGGVVVGALAVEHPDLVLSIVGIDPGYELPEPDLAAAKLREETILGPEGLTSFAPGFGVEWLGESEWIRTWRTRRLMGTPPFVYAGSRMGMKALPHGLPWLEYLAKRECPVLVMHRTEKNAKLEASTFQHPMSRFEIWDNCGHWFHQQRSEEVNVILAQWIEQSLAID